MNAWPIAAMTNARCLLHCPLGVPGSGRVRYGAAMTLWRDGLLSEPQLEVYREAAAHDARDPAPILAERHLPPVPALPEASPLAGLYHALRDYLLALDHPGAAEVRTGLPPDPGRPSAPRSNGNTVVDRWLAPALATLDDGHLGLAQAIAAAAPLLEWQRYDAYPPDEIGPAFAEGHAFAPVLGDGAPFAADDFDMGLFLIAPGLLYRDHAHPAPELYAPLTGPHGWRFGADRPLVMKPAHMPVWNPPEQPHLTRVGSLPFLAIYVWTRDVTLPARILPATDWDRLEMLPDV